MAFESVTFPDYPMKHGLSRDTIYPITVRSNGTTEWRGTHVRFERFRWNITGQTMTPEQKETIRSFLVQRNHGLNSFRFKDPNKPTLTDAPLSSSSGTLWNLYLPFDASTPGDLHPIYNPQLGELTAEVNAVPAVINGMTFVDNVPVIDIAGSAPGDTVTISGNLYFTVKLITPLSYAIAALDCTDAVNLYNVQPIQIQEVFGEY